MFKDIVRAYKFYNINELKSIRYNLVVIVVVVFPLFIGNKLFGLQVEGFVFIITILLLILGNNSAILYRKYEKGYATFIRTIPKGYKYFKIHQVLKLAKSIVNSIVFFIATGISLDILIKTKLFNKYILFYILVSALFLHGLEIAFFSYLKPTTHTVFISGIFAVMYQAINPFLLGIIDRKKWYTYFDGDLNKLKAFEEAIKSPQTIAIISLSVFLYICLIYAIEFMRSRKEW